jgi:hypothetical protein
VAATAAAGCLAEKRPGQIAGFALGCADDSACDEDEVEEAEDAHVGVPIGVKGGWYGRG